MKGYYIHRTRSQIANYLFRDNNFAIFFSLVHLGVQPPSLKKGWKKAYQICETGPKYQGRLLLPRFQ